MSETGVRRRVMSGALAVFAAGPLAAVLAAVPWLIEPCGIGWDNQLHRRAVLGWLDAWRHGVAWPGYIDTPNAGLGSFWTSYYPPLFYVLTAAGMAAGLDYWRVAMAAMVLAQAGGSLLCYCWLRRHAGPAAALGGTLAYVLAPYTTFNHYLRGAFPEGFAVAWLPGVFWGIDRVRDRWDWRAAAPGIVGFALISLGNLPALVVAGVATAGYIAVSALTARNPGALVRGLSVPALGLGLTAFSWLAAWLDSGTVSVGATDLKDNPRCHHYIFYGAYDAFLRPDIFVATLYALTYFLLALAVALAAAGFGRWRDDRGRSSWWLGAWLLACGLWLSGDQAWPAYRYVPLLSHIQYPWRFLGVTTTGLALLIAVSADAASPARRATAAAALAAVVAFDLFVYYSTFKTDLAPNPAERADVLGDFLPGGCRVPPGDHGPFPRVAVVRGDASAEVVRWRPGLRSLATRSDGPFTLLLATYADPRWEARDQDGRMLRAARWGEDEFGRLAVEAPPGTTRVTIALVPTENAAFAAEISLLCLANVLVFSVLARALGRRDVGAPGGPP